MNLKSRLLLYESVFTATTFTVAVYVYYFAVIWGTLDYTVEGPLRDYMTSPAVHIELLFSGVLFGAMLGVINRATERPWFRNRGVGQLVFLRTGLYLIAFAAVGVIIVLVLSTFAYSSDELWEAYGQMTFRSLASFGLWLILTVGLISLALEVERVLGRGNLLRLFLGRYRRPREEERVFLFMDLRGSTPIAEELGHRRYSELLQECFRDLTSVVLRHDAAVYQYVGDEVVMTWSCSNPALERSSAVEAFFAYQRVLQRKSDMYEARFGMVPEFRGGIDVGPVTVIEVGDVKREIVYHGDVLNTASRLLDTCKDRNESLVVSRSVGDAVTPELGFETGWEGAVPLRGKREPVEACSLFSTRDVA